MSLESQVAALVSAASNLTSQVAGKMSGIDQRMESAERQFDEFTGQDFPQRVSDARKINVYLDPAEGNDNNSGTTSASPVRSWQRVRDITGGSATIYGRVVVFIRAGAALTLDTVINALETLEITQYGTPVVPGTATRLYQGFYTGGSSQGRPLSPLRAPYVLVDQRGDTDLEIHTAEFPSGHHWPEIAENNRNADWMCYAGSMFSNTSRYKLRNVKLHLHDMPFSTIYMSGSLGDFAKYEVVLGAGCQITGEAPGAGSGQYTHKPKLIHVYANPKVPLDIVASDLTLGGSLTTTADLFDNLNTENVRSSFAIQ